LFCCISSALFYVHAGADEYYTSDYTLEGLSPIVVRIFTILVLSAGAVFVFMVAYGIWKSSMSLGDPNGLDAAKKTWSFAVFGFLVVILFLVLGSLVASVIGKRGEFSGGVGGIVQSVFDAIEELWSVPGNNMVNGGGSGGGGGGGGSHPIIQ